LEKGPYELADYTLKEKTKLLVLLNAWLLSSEPRQIDDEKHDWNTLQYWADRLRPLWAKAGSPPPASGVSQDTANTNEDAQQDETIVVVCNRSGTENGTTFAGTSSIFSMSRNSGGPKLLDMMEQGEEAIRVWNILI